MFGRTTDDIAKTLTAMHEQARTECKYNQPEMARRMAEWMALDRRFDSIPDKAAFAADVMDARQHGRQIDLTERYRPTGGHGQTTSPTRYR